MFVYFFMFFSVLLVQSYKIEGNEKIYGFNKYKNDEIGDEIWLVGWGVFGVIKQGVDDVISVYVYEYNS